MSVETGETQGLGLSLAEPRAHELGYDPSWPQLKIAGWGLPSDQSKRRARAFSDRANSGVGHCGRTRGRNHPPPRFGIRGLRTSISSAGRRGARPSSDSRRFAEDLASLAKAGPTLRDKT
jgi:hypothetical protein